MIETFTGANDFARTQALQSRAAAFAQEHGDFAVERLDGESASAEQMRASVESLPFLTPRKLVILREPGKQKAFAEQIGDVLKVVSDSTDVIIVEPKLDKRLSYYKTLKKDTQFQEFSPLDAPGLSRWAAEYAKQKGGSLSTADAKLIVDRMGINQQAMQLELDKLLAYNPAITKQTIELLTDRLPQSTVFELLDAAFAGNLAKTMQLYKEQRELKVEPQAIIAMLAWQLHILAVVKTAGTKPADEVARAAKLNPFVVRKTQTLARKITLPQLKQLVAELLKLDVRLKRTTTDADDAVQLYLIKLAQN
ncbi:MAG TPA: DNA polymerase III subunit delta [Candidatus Saccharimonadales bacterium]|nr:DNA polymerase III subunit delta [Candidatus Saccharimonadales bacterium]